MGTSPVHQIASAKETMDAMICGNAATSCCDVKTECDAKIIVARLSAARKRRDSGKKRCF